MFISSYSCLLLVSVIYTDLHYTSTFITEYKYANHTVHDDGYSPTCISISPITILAIRLTDATTALSIFKYYGNSNS